MPIYEYKCRACNHRFSVLQRVGAGNEDLRCEKCGEPRPIKQFSTFASSGTAGDAGAGGGQVGSGFT
jgi:putative FmdB family regulatory protein